MIANLKAKIRSLEENKDQTLLKMVELLSSDPDIQWLDILDEQRRKKSWEKIKKRPKYFIIKHLSEQEYKHGRVSGNWRSLNRCGRQENNPVCSKRKRDDSITDLEISNGSALVQMKMEQRSREEFAVDVGLCGNNDRCRALARRVDSIRPYSNVAEKRKQRDEILNRVADALALTASTGRDVCVWYLDDILPLSNENGSEQGAATSLTMDLLLRFGGQSGCRLRLFTPNLKRAIVDHVRSLQPLVEAGRLITGVGCVCSFNARWASEMRLRGGLDVVMLDGFGGLKHGVLPILRQMVDLQLLRVVPAGGPPVPLMIVLSDRADRAEHGSVLKAALAMCIEIPRIFSNSPTYALWIDSEEAYGGTMHVLRCNVQDREFARSDLPHATGHVVYRVVSP